MKRVLCMVIVAQLLLSTCSLATVGLSKEETVYVNLDYEGNVEQINIYNKCVTNGAEKIIDYTNFETVSNLTNKDLYTKDEDKDAFMGLLRIKGLTTTKKELEDWFTQMIILRPNYSFSGCTSLKYISFKNIV